jgi:hypothetical protein
MKAIMLRRLKDTVYNGAPLIQLPPRTLEIVSCDFDDDERDFYAALEAKINLTMNKFIKQGDVMRNYTVILVLLLRLRQGEYSRLPDCPNTLLDLTHLQPVITPFWYQRTSKRMLTHLTQNLPDPNRTVMTMTDWQTFSRRWASMK